jgi:hypothetical protein
MTRVCLVVLAASLALTALVACLGVDLAGAQTRVVAEGRVLAADLRRGTLTFAHDAIPGLGPADTTDLRTQRPELLDGIRVGDPIRLTLEVAEGTHGLLTVVGIEPIPAERQTTGGGAATGGTAGRDGERVPAWAPVATWAPQLGLWLLPVLAAIMAAIAVGALIPGYLVWRLERRHGATLVELEQSHDALRADLEAVSRAVEGIGDTFREKHLRDIRRRLDAVQAARGHGPKPGGANGSEPGALKSAPAHLVVLRRDGPMPAAVGDLVRALQERLGRTSLVRVIRDRRQADRRRTREQVGDDRRRVDRRGAPPETWASLGLALAPGDGLTAGGEGSAKGVPSATPDASSAGAPAVSTAGSHPIETRQAMGQTPEAGGRATGKA